MNDFPFLVANSKPSKDRLTVTAPWDQSVICDVPVADSNAVEIALSNAYTIFKDRDRWLAPYKRIEILDKTVEIMQSRFEELAIEAFALSSSINPVTTSFVYFTYKCHN